MSGDPYFMGNNDQLQSRSKHSSQKVEDMLVPHSLGNLRVKVKDCTTKTLEEYLDQVRLFSTFILQRSELDKVLTMTASGEPLPTPSWMVV